MAYLSNQTEQAYYESDNYGSYQFTSLQDIINNFMVIYVGEGKVIPKAKRLDVAFHAQRGLAELSFDVFKSCKAQEITVPATLQMTLPQDYVNYTKISWVDSAGVKHLMYPTTRTSNPISPLQNSDGLLKLQAVGTLTNNSNTITLDDEYKDILVGMSVSGPSIPSGAIVAGTSNSGGITTITMEDSFGVVLDATYTGDETIQFVNSDGSLILKQESSFILENVEWVNLDNKITQSPNTDVSNVKVGMLVSHEYFPVGTTVTAVNGAVISTSNNSLSHSLGTNEVTFIETFKNSTAWSNYKSASPSENNNDDYEDDTYWAVDGNRYGLNPQQAQANGSFYIDCVSGKIHFSSNISGKTVILDYISDSLGTDEEMQVHKFAEEAMYKWITHAILSGSSYGQALVPRLTKEKFAAVRKAKLRLSNIKLEELTQILRGKSKQIKH